MTWRDEDLDAAFRGLRDEEPPAAALTALRARVLDKAGRGQGVRMLFWMGLAGAAAMLVLVLLSPRRPAELASLSASPIAAPQPPPFALALHRPAATRVARVAPPRTPKAAPSEEFVRLMTDDPDVVILWAVDSKGDLE